MKKILPGFFICMCIGFFDPALAAAWSSANYTKVNKIYVQDTGNLYVEFEEMIDEGCTYDDWLIINYAHTEKDELYAALLSAKASGSGVRYYVEGCSFSHTKIRHIIFD